MKKIIIAVIIAINIICLMAYASSDTNEPSKPTRDMSVVNNAKNKLLSLGLIEGVDNTDVPVTKAEFAYMMAKILGISNNASKNVDKTAFIDVPVNHKYCSVINYMFEMGYLSGNQHKRFNPDENITSDAAITITVNMLGYKLKALSKGGYPAGYLAMASDLKLNRYVYAKDMTYNDVYLLMNAAIEVDVNDATGYGTNVKLETKKGVGILQLIHRIYKDRGIVTATSVTNLVKENMQTIVQKIEINGQIFSYKNVSEHLGMDVDYYYTENGGDNELLYIAPRTTNIIKSIKMSDITKVSSYNIEYNTESGKTDNFAISKNTNIIYNNKVYTGYADLTAIMPPNISTQGELKLLDNNNDGIYEVLFISVYRDIIVGSVDVDNQTVYDTNGLPLSLRPADNDVGIFDNKGDNIGFSSIEVGNVLSVYTSINSGKKYIAIYISKATVTGQISEVSNDEKNKVQYSIGNAQYSTSAQFNKTLNIEDAGKFYLNYKGMIADCKITGRADMKLGVVTAVGYNLDLTHTLKFKVFTQDSEFITLSFDDTIQMNGVKSTKEQVASAITPTGISTVYPKGVSKMIRYRLNDKSKLMEIEVAAPQGFPDTPNKFRIVKSGTSFFTNNNVWGSSSSDTTGYCVIPKDAVIFSVPKDLSKEDGFEIINYSVILKGYDKTYPYTAYSVGDTNVFLCRALKLEGYSTGDITDSNLLTVVTRVNDGLNDNGDIVRILSGVTGNNDVKATFKYGTVFGNTSADDIKPGDILRIGVNRDGEIANCETVLRYNDKQENGAKLYKYPVVSDASPVYNIGNISYGNRVTYAQIQFIEDGFLYLSAGSDTSIIIRMDKCPVVKYDSAMQKCSSISATALFKGQWITVYSSNQATKCIVVKD